MHTVIILNKRASDLLKDFKFLFKPFVDEGIISFCDWNEFGTDIKTSVPDLYKLIKGKTEWRAVVLGVDSTYENLPGPVADEKNPFDFPEEKAEDNVPRESRVPLIRLAHMICGYPASMVKNFVKGFEYQDVETNERKRVRESELTEEEIQILGETYRDRLKSIYLEELVSDEVKEAQKALQEKYSFTDVRPRELLFISTRKHIKDEEHIYASWQTQFEMESSNFCSRNKYPSTCRFMCYSLTNAENSRYMRELIEFWLCVLTIAINKIPASTLQAYRLYKLHMELDDEEFENLLNTHLNKMTTAYNFVQERLKIRPEYTFEPEETLVEAQKVPVVFDNISTKGLHVDTSRIGLSRDCPQDELEFWRNEMNEKHRNVEKFLKTPRRGIDRASQFLKSKVDSFYGEEYELDEFQVSDLKEEIERLEQVVLDGDSHGLANYQKLKEQLEDIDRQVKKDIAVRMRRNLVIGTGLLALLIYLGGFIPYLFDTYVSGSEQFGEACLMVLAALILVALGGIVVLFIMRHRLVNHMEKFNSLSKKLVADMNSSAAKFENYFTAVCTYMKAQAIQAGTHLKNDAVSSARFTLRAHRQALCGSIDRDEELLASYGLKREPEVVKNVSSFFDVEKIPVDNKLYYYPINKVDAEIPVNETGDLIRAPYKFVAKLKIEREDIFDNMKGDFQ